MIKSLIKSYEYLPKLNKEEQRLLQVTPSIEDGGFIITMKLYIDEEVFKASSEITPHFYEDYPEKSEEKALKMVCDAAMRTEELKKYIK